MKFEAVLLVLVMVFSGCVGLQGAASVSQIAPTQSDLEAAGQDKTIGDVDVQTYRVESNPDYQGQADSLESTPEEEVKVEADIKTALNLPDGYSFESTGMDPGDLPGIVEKGTYFIKKDGKTVLMLMIGRFEDASITQKNYVAMKNNLRREQESGFPNENPYMDIKVEHSITDIDLATECSAARRTYSVTMTPKAINMPTPPPGFTMPPSGSGTSSNTSGNGTTTNGSTGGGTSSSSSSSGQGTFTSTNGSSSDGTMPQMQTQKFSYTMQLGVCAKSVFMFGLMQAPGVEGDYMKPIAQAVLNKI